MKGKASILVVDDDENICKTLSLILESRGYKVDVAYSGEKAIEKSGESLQHRPPRHCASRYSRN